MFLKACGAGSLVVVSCGKGEQISSEKPRKPNIIFILADDLGYGDLGCYGQKEIQTPNIDRLAAEGMRFTDHYAGSTVCAPSRCCLMTGQHTGHTYIRGNRSVEPMGQEPIPAETFTVAEMLKQAGYATGLIGKWGLGGPDSPGIPNRQGFDYFFGYLCQGHAHNYYPEFLFRNEERVILEGNRVEPSRYEGAGVAYERAQYSHDLFAREALEFIDRSKHQPFFLYLALTIPHANNEAGKEGMEVPSDEPYANRDWPQQQKNHAAMITRMDRDIGTMMRRLKDLGIDENTIVFFTSDNGPHREGGADPDFFDSNGSLRGIKRDLYEGGIRVPMIVRWPGKISQDTVSNHVSTFWDFMPTAADLTGTSSPGNIDGISYLPALMGRQQKEHDFLYWEFHEGTGSKQAVRMSEWKAVKNLPSKPIELYNLTTDIEENNDVAGYHPEITGKIKTYLKIARTESKYWHIFEKK
ncbi:MAG: arylsulfatase [Candidatus Latescibacteria bacterium]|nr:arylsulfatase [Candidatus Latescibacterota bacterium]